MCRNLFVRSLKRSTTLHTALQEAWGGLGHRQGRQRFSKRLEAAKWQNLTVSTLYSAFKPAPLQSLLMSHSHTCSYCKSLQLNEHCFENGSWFSWKILTFFALFEASSRHNCHKHPREHHGTSLSTETHGRSIYTITAKVCDPSHQTHMCVFQSEPLFSP